MFLAFQVHIHTWLSTCGFSKNAHGEADHSHSDAHLSIFIRFLEVPSAIIGAPYPPMSPNKHGGVRGTSGHLKQTESAEVDPRPKSWWVTELERLWGGFGSPIRNGAFFFVSGTVGMSGISVLKWVGLRISGFSGLSDIELV